MRRRKGTDLRWRPDDEPIDHFLHKQREKPRLTLSPLINIISEYLSENFSSFNPQQLETLHHVKDTRANFLHLDPGRRWRWLGAVSFIHAACVYFYSLVPHRCCLAEFRAFTDHRHDLPAGQSFKKGSIWEAPVMGEWDPKRGWDWSNEFLIFLRTGHLWMTLSGLWNFDGTFRIRGDTNYHRPWEPSGRKRVTGIREGYLRKKSRKRFQRIRKRWEWWHEFRRRVEMRWGGSNSESTRLKK